MGGLLPKFPLASNWSELDMPTPDSNVHSKGFGLWSGQIASIGSRHRPPRRYTPAISIEIYHTNSSGDTHRKPVVTAVCSKVKILLAAEDC